MKNQLLTRLINDVTINIYNLTDILLPNITLFIGVKTRIMRLFWNIGPKSSIRKGNRIRFLKDFNIGVNTYINESNFFDNPSPITIGDDCFVGYQNLFLTGNHIEKDKVRPENEGKNYYSKPITIGNNVWITSNCTILPGTVIEDNVILSAGSVANGRLEKGWIYRGNPAKKVRRTKGVVR